MVQSTANKAFWTVAPFNPETGLVERAWEYDRKNGVIAIGWDAMREDIATLDSRSLERIMARHYPDHPGAWRSVWAFYHRMKVGDYVVARTGRSTALGLGRITSHAYRDDAKGQERTGGYHPWFKPHFRRVTWLSTRREQFNHYVFPIATVTQLGTHLPEILDRYRDVFA
jgi:predicted Mrr-cat superfamily restriction endonuclease